MISSAALHLAILPGLRSRIKNQQVIECTKVHLKQT
jgi:hypothetical protein